VSQRFVEPTQVNGAALVARGIEGPVEMLNLLRFRDVADYSRSPELAPDEPISGEAAYALYSAATLPHVAAAGAEVTWVADGAGPLIGPSDERWDRVLVVRYPDVATFLSMTTNEEYLATVGHRTAALEDSRLFPLVRHTGGLR
jgi:uncharacterized protein (DUF1330 family)